MVQEEKSIVFPHTEGIVNLLSPTSCSSCVLYGTRNIECCGFLVVWSENKSVRSYVHVCEADEGV